MNIYVLLTAAIAISSYTRPNGAAMRECMKYGIAQSRSQKHIYFMSWLGWLAHVHAHKKMNKITKKSFHMYMYVHDRVQRSNAVVFSVV